MLAKILLAQIRILAYPGQFQTSSTSSVSAATEPMANPCLLESPHRTLSSRSSSLTRTARAYWSESRRAGMRRRRSARRRGRNGRCLCSHNRLLGSANCIAARKCCSCIDLITIETINGSPVSAICSTTLLNVLRHQWTQWLPMAANRSNRSNGSNGPLHYLLGGLSPP
jgi:hypothetical protein